jgi:hypothetical protein
MDIREAISAAERLPITLRYLATADSYHSLEYLYRIPVSTLSTLIPETCRAIYDCLIEGWQVLKFILQSAFYSAEGCISFQFNQGVKKSNGHIIDIIKKE